MQAYPKVYCSKVYIGKLDLFIWSYWQNSNYLIPINWSYKVQWTLEEVDRWTKTAYPIATA